jgi:hypothetical protein
MFPVGLNIAHSTVPKCLPYLFLILKGNTVFLDFFLFLYVIQLCFICRPSDYTVSDDAGIEPRTVATLALTARRSNHSVRSHPPFLILTFF